MSSRLAGLRVLGLGLLTALSWQVQSPTAMAKSCDKKVVVMEFLGPQNANVRTGLVRTLDAQGCDLERSKSMDDAARRMGLRMHDADDFVKVGKKLKLDGYIEGTVKKKGRRWSVEISVRNAHDGENLKTTSFSANSHRALAKQVQRNGWQRLGGAIKIAGTATETEETEATEVEALPPEETSKEPAKSTGIRVAVLRVRGAMGSQVRSNIQEGLAAEGHEIVSSAETDAVAEAFVGTPESAEDFAKLGAELNVHAIISARVKKESGAYMLEANAHSGRDGMSLTSTTGITRNKKNLGTTAEVTAQRLSPKLHYGRLPESKVAATTSPDEEAAEDQVSDEEEEGDGGGGKFVALDASLGPWLFSRNLSYTDNIFNQVRGYSVFPAFGFAADLTWFPGAHFSDGFIAHLGLTGAFQTSFGLNSSAEGSTAEFPTSAQAYSIGLVGRIPLGALEILPSLSYGNQSFEIDHANAVTPKPANIPNVSYEYLRIGAGARFTIDEKWAILGSLGYRFVMSAGEIEDDYFPRLSVGAIDLEVGAAYRIVAGFEVRLTLDMQRYFMSMNPEPGDAYVAGGAIDQWFGATLSAAYRL
jgi:TolB-like protein